MKLPPLRSWLRPRASASRVDIAATIENALRVLPGAARARLPSTPAVDARPRPAPASPPGIGDFFPGRAGTRDYKLFVPPGDASIARPLLVMLHGCTQDPDDFARGTRMNELAARRGVIVVYPQQTAMSNPAKCWNWFRGDDQQRGAGEPDAIMQVVRQVMAAHRIDGDRVYAAGLSAGGAMAAILAREYPDVFAAVGVHSGLAPGAAFDAASAFAAMREGHRGNDAARGDGRVPVIVFHGDRDTTVHPANAGRVLAALLPRDAQEESADDASSRRSLFRSDGRIIGESWTLRGTGHAWSGGSAAGTYTAPGGIDASAEMLRFFLQHPRRKPA